IMMYDSTHYDEKSDECPDLGSIDNSDTGDRNGSRVELSGEQLGSIPIDRLAMEGVVSTGDWDFESLPTAGVQMQEAAVQQAGRLSQSVVWPARQWSVYLQGLAVWGFEDWLRLHSSLSVVRDRCSTFQPALANILSAACNLSVGQFQLCVIPVGALGDDRIEIPRAAIELPQFSAHFFVLVEVLEDCRYVQILGVAPRQHLIHLCQQTEGVTSDRGEESWNYFCPTTWFKYSKDDLLLWLKVAEASQIELPPAVSLPVTVPLRARMQQAQSDLAARPIWQVLNWFEAKPLLVNPGWTDWLLGTAQGLVNLPLPLSSEQLGQSKSLGASAAVLGNRSITNDSSATGIDGTVMAADDRGLNRAVNVGMWLHDRMGALAEELAWMMMAPSAAHSLLGASQVPSELAVGMRDLEGDVDAIIGQLLSDGLDIPSRARGAYRQVQWDNRSLRMYALTWPHLSTDNEPEWTLLVVLGPTPGHRLPPLTRLRVRDATQLLVEQTLSDLADDSYLYAHVIGSWDEQFWVTIDVEDTDSAADSGSAIYLPPFQFKPGVVQL
ncbi:MAG: DUF1822 family protein, partial [Cyanobacteria bacterium P01_E01_bin.34]